MTVSKDARRREDARKRQRNVKLAKSAVIGVVVVVTPLLFYLATRI